MPNSRMGEPDSVSTPLQAHLQAVIAEAGGWLPFDRFMALALYAPQGGYYAHGSRKFGHMPQSGSDFVTAPELSGLFGQALARQLAQALAASGTDEIFEFGAGSGALAEQLISSLDQAGVALRRYTIIDLSGSLRERQAARLARFGERVQWAQQWPAAMRGVVVGNEVLDAMPVQLLHFDGQQWFERGVACVDEAAAVAAGSASGAVGRPAGAPVRFCFADRPTELRPPLDAPFVPGTTTEIHPQAEAFIRSLAEHLACGAAFFIDYGFPEAEYYLPQRHGGTLMCHQAHRADADPLSQVGQKDITAHVNFTGVALAAQQAGLSVLGYTSQARFLLNCGLAELMAAAELRERSMALRLVNEHEMGELFKVIALGSPGLALDPLGFAAGDRTHRL